MSCKKEKESGLVNVGNTCYANTGLQILFYIGPLRAYISEKYADDINEKPEQEFVRAFSSLMRSLSDGHYAVRPSTFIRSICAICSIHSIHLLIPKHVIPRLIHKSLIPVSRRSRCRRRCRRRRRIRAIRLFIPKHEIPRFIQKRFIFNWICVHYNLP